jgi:serpin B
MAELGARGETLSQIERTFGTASAQTPQPSPSPGDDLIVANRLWLQSGFSIQDDFLNACKTKYGAEPGLVDFKQHTSDAAHTINQWVEDQTHGKIKDLIPPHALSPMSRLVLTNAVYFKSNWMTAFDAKATWAEDFTLLSGKKVKIPLMHHTASFKYAEDDDVQAIQLPYAGGRYAMVVILPKTGVTLAHVEKKISVSKFSAWETAMKSNRVALSLPSFKMDASFLLNDELKKLGVKDAFEKNADFSAIDGAPDLYIADVFHKAFVKVDEAGTEAAAATAVHMEMKAMMGGGQKPIEFSAKKPFIFYIEEVQTKTIFFLGRQMDPKS